jgi:hypothetical protein
VKRELGAFAFFLALAIAITWPLALNLDSAVPDRGDPLLTAWIVDWVCHALTSNPLNLFHANIYHPARYALAFSENMIGIALFVVPFHLAGLPALTTLNIALILGFAFSGYGAWVLSRTITNHIPAALIGGIIYAFGSFKIAHIQHIQIVSSGWLPLLLAALLWYWRTPTTRRAALLAGAFVMNGLTSIHWLLFGGFAIVVTIAFLAIAEPRRERAFWVRLIGALAVAGLVLVPFLIPYTLVAEEYGMKRTSGEARRGSATITAWLTPSSRSAVYGDIAAPELHLDERELFPGLLAIFLAIYAIFSSSEFLGVPRVPRFATPRNSEEPRNSVLLDTFIILGAILTYLTTVADRIRIGGVSFAGPDVPAMLTVILLIVRFLPQLRHTWQHSRFGIEALSASLWILIGFVASLGWNAFLHPFLFRVVSPFRATRTPARWAVIAYVGLAVWAALGVSRIRKRAVAVALVFVAMIEVTPKLRWQHVTSYRDRVYTWLAQTKPNVIVELPMTGEGVPFEYVLASTGHRVKLINGTSGWETPLHEMLRKKEVALTYDDEFLDALIENGCELLIVHESRLTPEQKNALPPLLSKLQPLTRFGTDAVFRIRPLRDRAPAGTASAPPAAPPR